MYYFAISQGMTGGSFSLAVAGAALLTASCGFLLTVHSKLSRLWLLVALTVFLFAHFVMMQLEASIFSLGEIAYENTVGLLIICIAIAAPFALAVPAKESSAHAANIPASSSVASVPSLARICLSGALFPVLYFLAGITILPFVTQFYAELIPPFHELMLWQLFRGFVFALSALPLIAWFKGTRRRACLVFAVVMPVIGGIAPLLLPNAAMPADVRLVHAFEITVSYVIYGAALGYLLYPQTRSGSS